MKERGFRLISATAFRLLRALEQIARETSSRCEGSELGGLRPADVLAASERRSVLPRDHSHEALDLFVPIVEQLPCDVRAGAGEVLGDERYKLAFTSDVKDKRRFQAFAPSPLGLLSRTAFTYGRPVARRALGVARRARNARH